MIPYEKGQIIPFGSLIAGLDRLPDSPALNLGDGHPVQTSHLMLEELLSQEAWLNSEWRFHRVTSEQIPIFYMHLGDVDDMVDFVESKHDDGGMWVTPKGHPREEP